MSNLLILVGTAIGLGILASAAKATPIEGQPNITAIEPFTVDKTACQGSCTVNGVATWQNQGDAEGEFTPQISASGALHVIGSLKTMQPGEIHTVTFSLPITAATSFCPVPD